MRTLLAAAALALLGALCACGSDQNKTTPAAVLQGAPAKGEEFPIGGELVGGRQAGPGEVLEGADRDDRVVGR